LANYTLTAAIKTAGNTKAIKDGSITPGDARFQFIEVVPNVAAFRRMVRTLEFDVCEMAPTTYMIAREFGVQFTAIPIFLSRGFHHSTIVYNKTTGVKEPKDLEGRKAGVRAYTVTSGVWTRGVLQSEFGVDHNKVTWVTDDEEHVTAYQWPANVEKAPAGTSLSDMIASGDIVAALSGMAGIGRKGAPGANWQADKKADEMDNIAPLIPNAKELEAAWYKRTNIYPIHDMIVVKNSVLEQHPELPEALFFAFKASKEQYLKELAANGPVTDDDKKLIERQALIGPDPLPFGVASTAATLEALVEYAYDQHLIKKIYKPEELFAPSTIDLK
jgi:4,5-dihydroxyphthalate decarboxylase